jgi:hypothetical protein
MTNNSAAENERLLRKFESDLDCFHSSFPLMQRPPQAVLYAVMAAYDSMLLPLIDISMQIDERAIGSRQAMRAIVQSINPALLWATSYAGDVSPESVADVDLIDDGGNFLTHARDYFELSAFHVMYSRGLMFVECDEDKKQVRFVRPVGSSFPDGYASAVVAQRAGRDDEVNGEQVKSAFSRWLSHATYRLEKGRIHFERPSQFASKEVSRAAEFFSIPETLELSDEIDLVGFTMGEFRRFWLALHSWSIAATELYLRLVYHGVAQARCIPTQIIPALEFSDAMISLTGLSHEIVDRIKNRLTYDTRDPRRDVFLQPLLHASESISWCPLYIKQSRPERNMLKLMSRSRSLSDASATIIGGREGQMLKEFGRLLAKHGGYDYKLNCGLRSGRQSAEVDLLAYNRRVPSEILIVEAKAVLAVDDVSEVQAATEQFKKAKGQLERANKILSLMRLEQKRSLFPFVDWTQVMIFRTLVITPDSSPLAAFSQDAVPVITLELVRTQFRGRDFKSPTAICEACKRKEWLKAFDLDGEDFYLSIKIGSVTYEFPVRGKRFDS